MGGEETGADVRGGVGPDAAGRRPISPREAVIILGSIDACESGAQLTRLGRAIAASYREDVPLRILRDRIARKHIALERKARGESHG